MQAGVSDDKSHNIAKTILLAMGEFFQIQVSSPSTLPNFFLLIQDDYLDCFGEPSITGKGGSDIEQSKCTWLIVQALDHVNDQQKDILKVLTLLSYDSCILLSALFQNCIKLST